MNHYFIGLTFIMFSLFVPSQAVWAQNDLFAGTPSPTPLFLIDHSFDNTDVDGTTLKSGKKSNVGDDIGAIAAPEAAKVFEPDDLPAAPQKDGVTNPSVTPTREPDIDGL